MFTILASQYVMLRNDEKIDRSMTALLNAFVLTHIAKNGLDNIQLLEQATITTHQRWTEIYKLSNLNVTADNWDMIKLFFNTYPRRENWSMDIIINGQRL